MKIIEYFSDPLRLIVGLVVFACIVEIIADAIHRARFK